MPRTTPCCFLSKCTVAPSTGERSRPPWRRFQALMRLKTVGHFFRDFRVTAFRRLFNDRNGLGCIDISERVAKPFRDDAWLRTRVLKHLNDTPRVP
ncbi:hypothetical protein XFF6994_310008 [Xanthomonas citri pv. fuscans]|nr:hypothetical protein XFF6994_310008 [Xanthomonas citri pv. fuscans]